MSRHHLDDPLPIAPSLAPLLEATSGTAKVGRLTLRWWGIVVLCAGIGILASLVAAALAALIHVMTAIAYHGRWTTAALAPDGYAWGVWTILIPVVGGLIVGLMARYGSAAIRGHGIPEAMEQILTRESRIPARMVLLKPLSAAIAIGTGGPFGAEGPIIATGGALGSLLGQILRTAADERRILLAAGAAAGMAATFGTPLAAVLLAIELLLFEFRARSFLPVLVATVTATLCRSLIWGPEPAFAILPIGDPPLTAYLGILVIGLTAGGMASLFTWLVYAVEDLFGKLPFHWMWWPMIGGIVVGIIGLIDDRALGVGYVHIVDLASGKLAAGTIALLLLWKAVAWVVALGSGTSGGTLAPLFILGGCAGALTGAAWNHIVPGIHLDMGLAALIGMAATFAGASRALLTSLVFAVEATHQFAALVPVAFGCAIAYGITRSIGGHSIMTKKIARRGIILDEDGMLTHPR